VPCPVLTPVPCPVHLLAMDGRSFHATVSSARDMVACMDLSRSSASRLALLSVRVPDGRSSFVLGPRVGTAWSWRDQLRNMTAPHHPTARTCLGIWLNVNVLLAIWHSHAHFVRRYAPALSQRSEPPMGESPFEAPRISESSPNFALEQIIDLSPAFSRPLLLMQLSPGSVLASFAKVAPSPSTSDIVSFAESNPILHQGLLAAATAIAAFVVVSLINFTRSALRSAWVSSLASQGPGSLLTNILSTVLNIIGVDLGSVAESRSSANLSMSKVAPASFPSVAPVRCHWRCGASRS
jgi:hypothetical protein